MAEEEDILISEYSKCIEDLLTINDPVVNYNEIRNTIDSLYTDAITGKIKLINQSDKVNEYYNMQERIPLDSISDLLIKKGNNYKGYHKYKIRSVIIDPTEVLEYIESYYAYILTNLKNIRNNSTKNLDTYKRLNRLYFMFSHDNLNLLTNNNLFKYFFHFDPYDGSKDKTESLAISLYLLLIINPIYMKILGKIAGDFKYNCFTTSEPNDINIEEHELNIQTRHIYEGFDNYILNNNEIFSTEISNYLVKRVFVLNEPSEPFIEDLNNIIKPIINKMGEIFNNNFSTISTSFQQKIAVNSITAFARYLTTKNILERENYISISNENDILNDENYIKMKFKELINIKEKLNLVSLELISFQFKEYPLFFLNSHIVSYNNYLNDILQDLDFLNSIDFISVNESSDSEHVPNITDWISRINIDEGEFENYITNNLDINNEFISSKSLEYAFNIFFLDVISRFIDSDEFHELIVVDLIKAIRELSSYMPEYREMIANSIGQIKLFIKIFLIKELLDKNLFGELYFEFELAFDRIEGGYANTNISSVINSLKNPIDSIKKEYLKFYKGVFYSSSIASTLNKIIDDYRI